MNAENKKRDRGKNYTEAEKNGLIDIVTDFKKIIENKATDGVTVAEKNRAWEKITQSYNSTTATSGERNFIQLRSTYEALKHKTKKKIFTHKIDFYKTGGGPSTSTLSCLEEKIAGMGGLQFTPEDNVYDSNSDFPKIDKKERDIIEDVEFLDEYEILISPEIKSSPPVNIIASTPPASSTIMTLAQPPKTDNEIKRNFVQKAKAKKIITKKVGKNGCKCDELCSLKKKKLGKELEILEMELKIKEIQLKIKENELNQLPQQ